MGFNMSWIFVDGIDQDALHEALDLAPTGGTSHWHDLGTSRVPWAGVTLKSGCCAVFAKYALVMDVATATDPSRLTRLPAGSRSILCVVLEHAMISYASLWQGGRFAWQIRHDSSQGGTHLEASGNLPPEFAGFRDMAMDRRRADEERRRPGRLNVDYVFDVPLDTNNGVQARPWGKGRLLRECTDSRAGQWECADKTEPTAHVVADGRIDKLRMSSDQPRTQEEIRWGGCC